MESSPLPDATATARSARVRQGSWIVARHRELLPTRYVHVVFTLPRELEPLVLQNRKIVYSPPKRASDKALTGLEDGSGSAPSDPPFTMTARLD